MTVVAPPGEQVTAHLPDGSTVTLNSDTRLRYARGFAEWPFRPSAAREVDLAGEAFFRVVPAERRFSVVTADARVDVLGTTFGVRVRPEAGGTQVTLASGRVRVVHADTRAEAVLDRPGASAWVASGDGHPLRLSARPLPRVLAWRDLGFSAIDEPLPAVLAEIERRFALKVTTEGVVPSGGLNLFYPRGATAEAILHDICLARGCRFWRTSQGFGLRFGLRADEAPTDS